MVDREIRNLRLMLKRWQKEGKRFFERNISYEPPLDQSHIWANLESVYILLNDVLTDWGED